MELIPAIDILDGQVVQLVRGDYDSAKVFPFTPFGAAHHWIELGATRLHIVNLNGARSGARDNDEVLSEIVRQVDVPVQISGGIRDVKTAESLLNIGVQSVILDTATIADQGIVHELGNEHVIAGVVARSGFVTTDGWTKTSRTSPLELITQMSEHGVTRFMYTDVDRVGTQEGPRADILRPLHQLVEGEFTVAGGIGHTQHLQTLSDIGIKSVVLGTSIYTGSIDFCAAVAEFRD